MKITKEEVLHVAHLARLEIDEVSIEKFAGQIGDILEYVDQLKQLDTTGVQSTSHALALTKTLFAKMLKPSTCRGRSRSPTPLNRRRAVF